MIIWTIQGIHSDKSVDYKINKQFFPPGDLKSDSLDEYFDYLSDMWFEPFKRHAQSQHVSSSGFEHTFLAEYSRNKSHTRVYGFHNWLYFHYLETLNRSIAYHGFSRRRPVGNKENRVRIRTRICQYFSQIEI